MVEILVKSVGRRSGRRLAWGLLSGVMTLALCGCVAPGRARTPSAASSSSADPFDDLAVLTEAMLLVQRYYVDEKPFQEVVYGAVDGMLRELDSNSSFLPPQPLAHLEEETQGRFGGIGVSVEAEKNGVRVIAPIEDSPAFRAGIYAGDLITAVNGRRLNGLSVDEAVAAIRGESGTSVTVTVARSESELLDVSLVRDTIRLASVRGARLLDGGIGYVRITQFSEPTVADFDRALDTLGKEKPSALILDLRDNPGGLLDAAVGVAERLLPEGKTIVTVRGRGSETPVRTYEAGACTRRFAGLPMAVLVNGGSASASEIVAGALQANGCAVLVGSRTYGKASVQNVLKLTTRPDCAVRLTTAHYYTPDGKLIHGKGLSPDLAAPVAGDVWRQVQRKRLYEERSEAPPDDLRPVRDVVLERACERLRGEVASKRE